MQEFEKEWSKMLGGEVYDATHHEFLRRLVVTRDRLWEYNRLKPSLLDEQRRLLREILGSCGENFHFNQLERPEHAGTA